MSTENPLILERKKKFEQWQALGFGYAKKFDRTHDSVKAKRFFAENLDQLRDATVLMTEAKSEVKMAGRIMNMREMGKLAFLKIRDGEGDFQICLTKNLLANKFKTFLKLLDLGDFCGFSGEFFVTKHNEPTLMVTEITPLSKALRPLPEKWHGLTDREACYRERNLDMITNLESLERFKLRSLMVKEIRDFFHEKEFIEIETPILQNQAGGAMAKVFDTYHNALDQDMVLRIASELDNKRAIGGGIERLFEIAKDFRNEGSDPSHLQEFTMLEWYAAYCDINDNKRWTEEMFHRLCKNVFKKDIFVVRDTEGNETEIDFGKKFAEARFPDLLQEFANLNMFTASDDEVRAKAKEVGVDKIDGVGRANLLDDIYKKTARCRLIQPTFVYDYPEELKPLAAPNGDGTASCFQLVVNTWEIVNSYGELIDPQVQRQLLEDQAKAKAGGDDEAMEVDEVFLKAMEHGFPPMTGSGFGIDRLIAIFTGQPSLRDVVLFPTMKPENSEKKALQTNLAVAILNTDLLETDWQALNAIGHLTAAYGAREGKQLFFKEDITTKDSAKLPLNTAHAIMVKQANNQNLIDLIKTVEDSGLHLETFTKEMLEFSDDVKIEQITKDKNLDDLEFLGVLVYGKKSAIENITKQFKLLSSLGNNTGNKTENNNKNTQNLAEITSDFEIFEGEFNREKAWKMINSRCDQALARHLAYVGASMEALAVHFGHEDKKEAWYLAGVLHDIDWNQTIKDEKTHCDDTCMQYLKANGASDEIAETIQSHHPIFGVEIDTDMKKALFACDELTGFSVAVALMRPTKMMGMTPKSVIKKLKDKRFAAAVNREDMKTCETYFNMPISEFLQILIPAWEKIAGDWDLK